MCLVVFAYRVRADAPIVLAANRDELHARPTAHAQIWSEAPDVAGGRDLEKGGSWLLVSRRNRLAAITNHRKLPIRTGPSRGFLVRDFVLGEMSAKDFAAQHRAGGVPSFNLLLFDGSALWRLGDDAEMAEIQPGIHGLSNARLDDPWPKVVRAKSAMERAISLTEGDMEAVLFDALADRTGAPDADLPSPGVGIELERKLAAPFILDPTYGTRSSTVTRLTTTGAVITEHAFDRFGALEKKSRITLQFVR